MLLDRVVEQVNTRLHRRPSCALHKRYRKLVALGHDKSVQFTGPTKLRRMPNIWPSQDLLLQAWDDIGSTCQLEPPYYYSETGTVGVSWPFDASFVYLQRQPVLWDTVQPELDGG